MKRVRLKRGMKTRLKTSGQLRKEVNILFANVPSSVQSSDLEILLGGLKKGLKYYSPAREYGERAWRIKGKYGTLVFWDQGNGWSNIMRIESLKPAHYKDIIKKFKYIKRVGWEE